MDATHKFAIFSDGVRLSINKKIGVSDRPSKASDFSD